eukprot:TRINITY_DN33309_c0_g1_i1.p1 TRINITY_DN33309_c0_g1~~TRINITY_DN33309_c0_g1_i1.p1  ORF type:complete len:180 (-),score=49.40 TRINITY_DN33309_c0_g1_i1:116-616(-)
MLRSLVGSEMCIRDRLQTFKTDQWSRVGFQGKDPSTDLRGLGMFGLMVLAKLCVDLPEQCQEICKAELPFAITALNLLHHIENALRENPSLSNQLFQRGALNEEGTVAVFSRVLGVVMADFDLFYTNARADMVAGGMLPELVRMNFNQICKDYFSRTSGFLTSVAV